MNTRKTRMAALVLASGLSGAAQAALFDRGGGLIYDDVLNVTWLQDANYAKTSGYDADGMMNWSDANGWTAHLSYYDSVRNVTYSDWRLPTMIDTGTAGCNWWAYGGSDCGYNVQTVSGSTVFSEMAHMYFNNLGLKSAYSTGAGYQADYGIFGNGTGNGIDHSSYGQNDVGLIDNLQSHAYWSGLENATNPNDAWHFYTNVGGQSATGKDVEFYAWAVRPGDVAAVPEPETYAMMLAGLGLIGAAARRRRG